MTPGTEEIRANLWGTTRCLALGLLMTGVAGCQPDAESEAASPSRWWYTESAPSEDEMAFRTAMLMAWEGWNGSDSQATSLTLFSDLYESGGLLIRIGMTGKTSRPRCAMQGCYLYARRPGGEWQVLRAVPADESMDYLDVLNPWSLQELFEGSEALEIEVPMMPAGECIYTLPIAGYRADLHQPAGEASLNGDGTPRGQVSLSEEDEKELDGPPSEGTLWPRCTGGEP